ncbi:MAG: BMP family ABC transporter substrate-binding protein [Lachnospirales bacterium]
MNKRKMKIVLAIFVVSIILASCANSPASNFSSKVEESNTSTKEDGSSKLGEGKTVALVCDEAGTQVFILSMIDGLNETAETYGFTPIIAECGDSAAYEDNINALIQEGTDLIIVGGWQGVDALNKGATQFPDAADYAIIDSTIEAENVKSISYREQEGAFLIGMMGAYVADENENTFGAIHVNQGPGSWKWRYGYMEGVKSVYPDAEFIFNYTGNFNDPAKAKEYALLQAEQGCSFINGASAGGDIGVFEAALEKGFYTSGQDEDLTNPENPYIISSQIKDTNVTIKYLLEKYFTEDWNGEDEVWGLEEGTIGAVYATHNSDNPMSDRLSEEELNKVKEAVEDIRSGKIDLTQMPEEENYENQ